MKKGDVKKIIEMSIDDLNQELTSDKFLEKDKSTKLFGHEGILDSLALVSFLVIIEQNLEDELAISITIANDKAMAQTNNPFESIESLTDFLLELIKDEMIE